jgi:hypothetical protein
MVEETTEEMIAEVQEETKVRSNVITARELVTLLETVLRRESLENKVTEEETVEVTAEVEAKVLNVTTVRSSDICLETALRRRIRIRTRR